MKLYQELTLLCVVSLSISDAAMTGNVVVDKSRKIVGVSSVAGLSSRNGRVSSIGGFRFYHAPDTVYTGSVQPQDSYYRPITIAEASDGRSASASVHYYPNSVVVSSSAGSGNIHHINPWFHKIPTINIFQSPEEIFEQARSLHRWLPKDIFKYVSPTITAQSKDAWSYPNYNPFHSFWR